MLTSHVCSNNAHARLSRSWRSCLSLSYKSQFTSSNNQLNVLSCCAEACCLASLLLRMCGQGIIRRVQEDGPDGGNVDLDILPRSVRYRLRDLLDDVRPLPPACALSRVA